ncbi:hypothetical protein V7S43_010556 [Phytophthora oleae]|uniref:Uncharacterized protein n=1 Tax=Phytophthora oleae TaxID=2107226 RepID=A0ABD3FCS9_9STRA
MGMSESSVDARFFKSGGSLRYFFSGDFRIAKSGWKAIEESGHAEGLLTDFGVSGDKQIDRIRMQGVQDRNNADHYVDMEMWTSCVTSRAVLNL